MSLSVYAEIIYVIVEPAIVADLRWDHQKSVLVVMDDVGFVVDIEDIGDLRGKTGNRKILAVKVGDKDIVFPEHRSEIVQPAIGVLVEQTKIGKIVLPSIV